MKLLRRAGNRLLDATHTCGQAAPAILVLLVAATPVFAWAIWGALRDADNDLFAWVDDRVPAKQAFNDFRRDFGRQELAIVSWPGCALDDPRLPGLAGQLSSSSDAACFEQITTGEELLDKLTAPPFDLPRSRVLGSLVGNMLGPDGQTSCLILTLSDHGAENRGHSIAAIRSAADRVEGLDSEMLRLGGPAVELWAITYESVRSPVILWFIAIVFIAIVSCILLRSLLLSALVVGIAVLNGAFSVAIVYFTGNGMNAVLMPMPTLVMVLSVSCSVHVVNYYREAAHTGCSDFARATLESAWLPCVLSAVTTAIGLAALVTSDTPPVREFGLYSAVSILLGTALILLILPSSLSRFFGPTAASARQQRPWPMWPRLALGINRLRWPVVLAGVGCIIVSSIGLWRLDTSMTLPRTFSVRTRVVRDAQWLEEHVRPLSQVETVLVFDKSCGLSGVRRLALVAEVARAVRQDPHMHATLSLADLLPHPPASRSIRAAGRRAIMDRYLKDRRESLIETGYLAEVGGDESWRISGPVSSLSNTQYADLLASARKCAEGAVNSADASGGIHIQCTGAIALYDEFQRQMFRDLTSTYTTAFLAITVTMCLVLGSVRAGLISMLPNLFPAVVMLGLLGWLNVRMDVGSIMTASVALGIAVDGTLHYVISFRRSVEAGASQVLGIQEGYSRCGVALVQATVICAVGIHFLGYSDFLPTARFGWLIAAMLGLALVGDLVLLPALLVGPLGRLFVQNTPNDASTT
ncbi:MAG: MMPL family transporter [Planctomycetes bacterium]|nr:MMPL family transporter [Planctomycetota bacterium]